MLFLLSYQKHKRCQSNIALVSQFESSFTMGSFFRKPGRNAGLFCLTKALSGAIQKGTVPSEPDIFQRVIGVRLQSDIQIEVDIIGRAK